jgi:DNA-damage-inducible protein D
MEEIHTLFNTQPNFEDIRNENGMSYWWARDLMYWLGYEDFTKFSKVLNKAIQVMMSLSIKHYDNIEYVNRNIDGKSIQDAKLTRFACYLIAMNGDVKKVEVAKAQMYFIEQTRQFELLVRTQNQVERVTTREELKEANSSLSSTAKHAGVIDYARFTNEGYLGMYNKINWKLAKDRGIDKDDLLEYMGKTELAANTLRAAMTEERIKNEQLYGQPQLEQAHRKVGEIIRKTVKEATGKYPEELPQEPKLPKVKSELKSLDKEMKKLDTKKNNNKKNKS